MEEILLDTYMQQMDKPTEAGAGTARTKRNRCTNLSTKYRGKNLGVYIVVNLGPRGSKRKVIKIERN